MNHDFYQYALAVLDNLSVGEMENGLREFGIDCQRRVFVFEDADIDLAGVQISNAKASSRRFLETELASIDCAANDNSYAPAA